MSGKEEKSFNSKFNFNIDEIGGGYNSFGNEISDKAVGIAVYGTDPGANQRQEENKEVLELLKEAKSGFEEIKKINGWEYTTFDEEFEEKKVKVSVKVKRKSEVLELRGTKEIMEKVKKVIEEMSKEGTEFEFKLVLPDGSKESENFSVVILVKEMEKGNTYCGVDLVAIKKEDREKLRVGDARQLTIKFEQKLEAHTTNSASNK